MELRTGSRLRSRTDATEIVVVRAPEEPVDLRCGGHPMVAVGVEGADYAPMVPGFDQGTRSGERYADDAAGIEILCTKAGPGSLSLGSRRLRAEDA